MCVKPVIRLMTGKDLELIIWRECIEDDEESQKMYENAFNNF